MNPLQLVITVSPNPISDCLASVSRTINVFYNEAPEITNLAAPDVCENSSFTLIEGVNFDIENEQSFSFSTLDNTGVIANNGTAMLHLHQVMLK